MKTPTPSGEKIDRTVRWCPYCSGDKESSESCTHEKAQVIECPEPGARVAGDYEFISLLGVGGMGVVYKCKNSYLDKIVAIKTLVARQFRPEDIVRFQQEAKAAGKFNHPNLVSILDFGITDDGVPFMSMEYLEGETLSAILPTGRLTFVDLLTIFEDCCDALAYAHRHKVLHRDLKPANIMLVGEGVERITKVLDFGIAKIADAGQTALGLTKTGSIFGTPPYMSPEQCSGGTVSERSDVYSLGCVMYEAFSGKRPFFGKTAFETFELHRESVAKPLSEAAPEKKFPQELDRLLARMLAKKNDERPAMDAVRWELDQILQKVIEDLEKAEEGSTKADSPVEEQTHSKWPRWLIAATLLTLICIGCAIGIWSIVSRDQPSHQIKLSSRIPVIFDSPDQRIVPDTDGDETLLDEAALSRTQRRLGQKFIELDEGNFTMPQAKLLGREAKNCLALRLHRNRLFTADKIHELRNMPIRNIALMKCDLDDAGLKELASSFKDKLEFLTIEGSNVTDKGFAELIACTKLRRLVIRDQKDLSSRTAKSLIARMPRLNSLDLSFCPLIDDGVTKALADRHLACLGFSNTAITGASLKHLSRIKEIEILYLDGSKLTDSDMESLVTKLPSLYSLALRGQPVTDNFVKSLAAREVQTGYRKLETLILDGTSITPKSLPLLKKFKKFKYLSLAKCEGIERDQRSSLRRALGPKTSVLPTDAPVKRETLGL